MLIIQIITNNLNNTGNIEPFVSTTQDKYGCAIINDKKF